MSCLIKVETEIRDRDCLEKVLKKMNYRVKEGGEVKNHNDTEGVDVNCGSFGFTKSAKGFMFIGGSDSVLNRITDEYAREMTYQAVVEMGGTVERDTVTADGTILMEVQVGA